MLKTAASFIVTENCNLQCKYCFECYESRHPQNDMTKEVAKAAVDLLFNQTMQSKENNRHVDITLFGGEPLLRPDMCDYIIRYAVEQSKQFEIPVSVGIITNGTIMNPEIELYLYRWKSLLNNFSIQISIDGNREAQDLYRVHRDGTSCFDALVKNIPVFESIGNVSLHGCLNKQSLPLLFDSYKYFIEELHHRGIIWFMPVHSENWDADDVKIYDEQLEKIFLYETEILHTVSSYTPIDKLLPCGHSYRHPNKTCGAGTNYISFTGNGDIYPCHNFYFSYFIRSDLPNPKVGNIFSNNPLADDNKVLTAFEECSQDSLGCVNCKNTACYRCLADNWTYNGDINKMVGFNSFRCKMSGIENKWQLRAVAWADKLNSEHKLNSIRGNIDPINMKLNTMNSTLVGILELLEAQNKRISALETNNIKK